MGTPEGCPCDAVKELKTIVMRHDEQLNEGNVNFALLMRDVAEIKENTKEHRKNWTDIVMYVVRYAVVGVLGYLAAKGGIE